MGYIDSFGIMDFLDIVEKKFSIKFKNNEIGVEDITTLKVFSKIILKKVK